MIPAPARTRIGIERRPGQPHAAIDRQEQQRSGDPDGEAEAHLDGELARDDREAAVVLARELDHPDHERDPDRVVHPGLALEDRSGAPSDLARAEDRERHGRVGGSDGCPTRPDSIQLKPEHVVSRESDEPGGEEGAEDAEGEDRLHGPPEAAEPDVEAAVEEDEDQRDDGDALDLLDRQDGLEIRSRSPR